MREPTLVYLNSYQPAAGTPPKSSSANFRSDIAQTIGMDAEAADEHRHVEVAVAPYFAQRLPVEAYSQPMKRNSQAFPKIVIPKLLSAEVWAIEAMWVRRLETPSSPLSSPHLALQGSVAEHVRTRERVAKLLVD